MSENKLPRVYVDSSRIIEGAIGYGIATPERHVATDVEYISLNEHESIISNLITESWLLDQITEWKHSWLDVKGTDERDRKNYFNRAFGIDANMKHDLARRILKALAEIREGK